MQNLLLYLTTVLIWGTTWIAIKFQLGTVDPLLSIAYRYGLAAVILFGVVLITRRSVKINFTRRQYFFMAVQGFFLFFLNYWLFYLTSQHLTSGLVAVTLSTITVMNIFNQALFFRIRVKKQVVLATLFGLAGIVFVFWPEVRMLSWHDENFRGIMLGLFATYTASLGNILSYRNSRDNMPVLETNMLGMAVGAAFSFLFAVMSGVPLVFDTSASYVLSLLYLSIFGSVIAFGAYLTLMARIGADRAGYAAVLFPIVALSISTFFEGYVWTPQSFFGVALILMGNVLALAKASHLKNFAALVLLKKNPA